MEKEGNIEMPSWSSDFLLKGQQYVTYASKKRNIKELKETSTKSTFGTPKVQYPSYTRIYVA